MEGSNGQFATASGAIDGRTFKNESGSLSYVGRLNYAYNDKYLAEFLYRTDASTKFAPENYWGNFYSVSAGWVISKEDFFKSSVVDFLKVRYSVGLLGKDDTKAWAWRQRYTFQGYKGAVFGGDLDNTNGFKMETTPNRDATWSDELKMNFGIDSKFLDNRLSFTAESYYNIGTNLLINRTGNLPFTIGGSVAAENYGSVDSYGYEVSLGWNDNIGTDFRYGVDLRFGWSDNKIIKGNFNDADILFPWNPQPGKSSDNGIWGYDYLGMFKNQAEVDAYVTKYQITEIKDIQGNRLYTADKLKPGMLYYRDIRSWDPVTKTFGAPDGIIDQYDQVQLAKKSDSHAGIGSTLHFSYKGFSFNTVINASFGGWADIDSNARKALKTKIPQIVNNTVAIWNDIYDADVNPNGSMPNPAFGDSNSIQSSFWEVNAFRIQCRNISLGYALPDNVLKTLNMNSCKFNLVALNPFNLYNPYSFQEANGSFMNYPTLRTISLGVNVGF